MSEFFYFNRLYNGQHVFKFPEHGSLTKMTLTPLHYTKMALRWGMKVFQPIEEEKPEEKHNDDLSTIYVDSFLKSLYAECPENILLTYSDKVNLIMRFNCIHMRW